ncbi:polysaccharide pyruvyl transferase family protein [Bacteroides caecigallinarum]|uniref:polysaccharide pyruvyl transferase family protein n=1 Tax=Bacteroides caecigallinarum TaxID=1411144 RepID=UPI0019597CDE|nr:polysaccharide pyruvyl transferase family protein [Bacteroides caecigallinarum]MBM6882049.1 polysaccharide pyruvyl transferase family protein [Bacteroides caecigallinarum]
MKIAILTQPLIQNYGCILQCYALQTILQNMGHEVVVLNRTYNFSYKQIILQIGSFIKSVILKFILRKKNKRLINPLLENYRELLEYNSPDPKRVNSFKKQYIRLSKGLWTSKDLGNYCKQNRFDVIIVGSDQVWRELYSPCITDYFLGFLSNKDKTKKIAYAASFGTSENPISYEGIKLCKKHINKFDAISTREISGVKLVKELFNKDASLVLDPTLLLSAEDYIQLIKEDDSVSEMPHDTLTTYILDWSHKKKKCIDGIAAELKLLNRNDIYPDDSSSYSFRMKSIPQWLASFRNARYVITDSFHGCVFSIIFRKDFAVIINNERGSDRFTSLLRILELEDRIISVDDKESIMSVLTTPIAYANVERKIEDMGNVSLSFLNRYINESN